MRRNLFRALLVATAGLVLSSAAFPLQLRVRAKVPFDFVLGEKVYLAGEYTLTNLTGSNYGVLIRGKEPAESGIMDSISCMSMKPSEGTRLIFHRVGSTYFLYQVWLKGRTDGREFLPNPNELQLTHNSSKSERVFVAADIVH